MMLRDLEGSRITNEIKDWIINKNNNRITNIQKGREKLENSEFFHKARIKCNNLHLIINKYNPNILKKSLLSDEIIQDKDGNYFLNEK